MARAARATSSARGQTFPRRRAQNLSRNWQNGRLWWNDPDAVVLTGNLPEEEFRFHATAIYASGGMMLSGDDLHEDSARSPGDAEQATAAHRSRGGVRGRFPARGRGALTGRTLVCLFNWGEAPQTISFRLPEPSHVRDYWTGEDLGKRRDLFTAKDMAPHSARLLECLPERPPDIRAFERERVLKAANRYLAEEPITVTASSSPRSAGGAHDFFSEGDYWWPDPKNPGGPYIQRDGMIESRKLRRHHRRYLMRSACRSRACGGLETHAGSALRQARGRHLRAWFVDEATRMSPHLQYSQAIHGRATGRGTGMIDTIHLVEVARAVEMLEGSPAFSKSEAIGKKGGSPTICVDDDPSLRHRGTQREKQSRDVLGDAGGRVRPTDGEPGSDRLLPGSLPDCACAQSDRRPTEAFRWK